MRVALISSSFYPAFSFGGPIFSTWELSKRLAEKNKTFDERFIELSREVYKTNDERAKIKLKINEILGSNIKEVKSHY